MRPILVLDTETGLITQRDKTPPLTCVSFAGTDLGSGVFAWNGRSPWGLSARDTLAWWLTGPWLLAGHNIAFDMAVIQHEYPELTPFIWRAYAEDRIVCTKQRQKLIDIANGELAKNDEPQWHTYKGSSYTLEAVTHRHLSIELDKVSWRHGYGELRHIPIEQWPEGARVYPVNDALATLGVLMAQSKHDQWLRNQYAQARKDFWLYLIGAHGMLTDVARITRLESKILSIIDGPIVHDPKKNQYTSGFKQVLLHHRMLRQEKKKGEPVFVRDMKVSRAFMVEACREKGVDVPMTKPSDSHPEGQVALGAEACELSGHPVLEAYAEYTRLSAILNKDVKALRAGEIHAAFDSLLETGRTSSYNPSEGGGYNVQNPARADGVRECFIARLGTWFVDADYDGLELRTMAQVCIALGIPSSLQPLLNARPTKCPHLQVAANLLGIPWEDAIRRFDLAKAGKVKDAAVKEARNDSKGANFGFPGGMGARKFVEYCAKQGRKLAPTYNESVARAYQIKKAWEAARPEFPGAYFPYFAAMTRAGPATVEQLYSGRFRGGCTFPEACNTMFQGLGADATNDAGFELVWRTFDWTRGSILYGARVANYIHDQFLTEVREAIAAECAHEIQQVMQDQATRWLPDVPATTTPALSRCWSKEAADRYDSNGRLTLWEEKEAA